MKPHEVVLRYQSGTWTVQHGGLPVAIGVDDEWGPMFSAAPDMARALLDMMPEAHVRRGVERHTPNCWNTNSDAPCLPECERAIAALKKAGVLP